MAAFIATAEATIAATAAEPLGWAGRLLPSCGGATRCVGLAGHQVLFSTRSRVDVCDGMATIGGAHPESATRFRPHGLLLDDDGYALPQQVR
jgi:hypothetical protein